MKLWLQVLFAQGWLWRDRFPEQFAEAKATDGGGWNWFMLAIQVVVLIVSIAALASGETPATGVVFAAGAWLLWWLSSRRLNVNSRRKELRLSLVWAAGLMFCVSALFLLALTLATAQWPLIPIALAYIVCLATGWLRAFQYNYLLFRQPDEYAWVLEGLPEPPKGLIPAYAGAIAETYWRLPKQILFPEKERHAH